MTNIRRYFDGNHFVFTTHVVYKRNPILITHGDLLNDALAQYSQSLIAWAILPDHFHCLLEYNDENPSNIFRKIKLSFSAQYRKRLNRPSGRVWQYRFWDHLIRNQVDLNNHIDYIHYNPVKHGYVEGPVEWKASSIHNYFKKGYYQTDWGTKEPENMVGEFGE